MDRLGPYPDQDQRPAYLRGKLNFAGTDYDFGSGGGGRQSIPFGSYPITPNAIGPWGAAHGAIGINNNVIPDAKLGRNRAGIELHAGTNPDLITQGCLAIAGSQWQQFRRSVMDRIAGGEKLFLHVDGGGARITSEGAGTIGQAPAAVPGLLSSNPVQTTAVQGGPMAPQSFGEAPQQPPGLLAIPGMQ